MNTITLSGRGKAEATVVPDSFLTKYMPAANGAYVKVYLLVLMEVQKGESVTLCRLADLLDAPESDIQRALAYWKKQGLIEFADDGAAETKAQETKDGRMTASEPVSAPEMKSSPDPAVVVSNAASEARKKSADSISAQQLQSKTTDPEFKQIMELAKSLLHTELHHSDIDCLIYFYDKLQFPADLIEFLINYAIERDHPSFQYMRKTADKWYNMGIHTRKEAAEETRLHSKAVHTVCRAFSLKRDLAPVELDYVEKWTKDYNMTDELIEEACSRTILKKQKPLFTYADSILARWHNEGVHDEKTMKLSDEAFKRQMEADRKTAALAAKEASASSSPAVSFPQRDDDLDALALRLQFDNSQ